MSAAPALVATAVLLAVGFTMGQCSAPETKEVTKYVTVPVIKTHVETKEVYGELPQSCKDAAAVAPLIMAEDEKQTAAAGELLLLSEQLSSATAFTDTSAVNTLIEGIDEQKEILADSINTRAEVVNRFTALFSKCETEVNDGP
jgi:hypothetical protein